MRLELRFEVRAHLPFMSRLLPFPGQPSFHSPLERREPELFCLARSKEHMG